MTGNVRSSATGGFIKSKRIAKAILFSAQTCRGKHSKRSTNNPHLIGKDVTKHVFRKQYVELVRIAGQLHSCIVHVHVSQFDLGCVFGKVGSDHLAPKYRTFKDIGFVDGTDAIFASLCSVDCNFCNALDFAGFVNHCVDCLLFSVFKNGR